MNRRIELSIIIGLIVVLSISCLLLYLKTLGLQSHLDLVIGEEGILQNSIQDLTQKTEDLKKPQFYTTQLNWSISQEASNEFRIDITGTVFNAGVNAASWVIAEPFFRIFGSGNQFLGEVTPQNFTVLNGLFDGDFEGKTFRSFAQSFHTNNLYVWNITAIEVTYYYSDTT